ncbi:MAG: transglutaminase-like cysteine peptidase [Devosia sp.]
MTNAKSFKRHWVAVVVAGLALSANTGGSAARESSRPPLGLQLYCLQHPNECQHSGNSSVETSNDLLDLLRQVNRHVNAAITPRADGAVDRWQSGASSGDCEDYVMTKRQMLIGRGIPGGALRVAYTKTRSGEGHAILVVHTEMGDLVLDNLVGSIKPLAETGYRVERISSSNLLTWTSFR